MVTFDSRKSDYGYIVWASEVKRRDHYTCVICGRRGVALNSHHLNAWASHPSERYDLQNGACLCQSCHDRFHATYGKGKNTKEQFEEFKTIIETLISLANNEAVIDFSLKKMIQEEEKKEAIEEILVDIEKYNA